ncbi:ATP-grasp fold amidoligase family protein [Butyrivibrio sp. AE3009]|uniref:ATP-grasp fold amidoligase family protein n=1 Tax=Butyrivibrio sp. AE3009 TaxID=1280666 RepID=UPI0003B7A89B|nr:ATP-grasp fold amidoligase family protein [Butyrivibrio sp. AE3009]
MEKISFYIKKAMPEILYPLYIEYKYKQVFGVRCNLKNPVKYTEKMQWAKLYRRNELLTTLTDKVAVREWVANRIGKEYLIPTIGDVFTNADDIRFDSLPQRYVIKTNNGSGFNIIVNDNETVNIRKVKKKLNGWLSCNYAYTLFELQYKDIKPKIYIEENLLSDEMIDMPDYKFFCFGGKVFCSYTRTEYTNHSDGKLGFFDRDYKLMPYHRSDYAPLTKQLEKPKNYELMVELAEKLSFGFSHVRVDLYNIGGKVYFGEMTFTNAGGLCQFEPDEFDRILGDQWNLNSGI